MTISMPDSTQVANLPDGYPAYLGYADGGLVTAGLLAGRFPDAHRVILTVTGNTIDCDGIDCEPGNVTAAQAALWAKRKLKADPHSRPVMYASVIGEPGYGMSTLIEQLAHLGVNRDQVRLLTAHYGQGPHICGPDSCSLIGMPMDGTQWTDEQVVRVPGGGTAVVDMSTLADDFFAVQNRTETEKIVQELPVVRQGDTGSAVRTVQGLCQARGMFAPPLAIDGTFGPATKLAVTTIQASHRIAVDGVVGPATWPVLLGVA